jgi:hypothetical protein
MSTLQFKLGRYRAAQSTHVPDVLCWADLYVGNSGWWLIYILKRPFGLSGQGSVVHDGGVWMTNTGRIPMVSARSLTRALWEIDAAHVCKSKLRCLR